MLPVYRYKDTLLHGLHPLAALALAASAVTAALVLENPLYTATLCVSVLALLWQAEVLREGRALLRAAAYMGLLVALINPLVNSAGEHVLVYGPSFPLWGKLNLTLEALLYGLAAGVRLFTVVAGFSLVTLAVNPDDLLELLSRLSFRSSLSAALAVRLYPSMVVEAGEMRDAQLARGDLLRGGGRLARARAHLPLLLSLFQGALDRAASIAESMSARGFGSRGRTRAGGRRLRPRDLVAAGVSLTVTGSVVLASLRGGGGYRFFPSPANPFTEADLASWALLTAAFAAILAVCGSWKKWHWWRSRI
ncbi:MAG: energy-coupling factor transporter transmembrane protein EcfT [Actinobacteria bacterium]|nr:energy-coupling factor transporter transmembrane protein EcfT [Actinomycetota bacterium]